MSNNNAGKWIGELFQPSFSFTVEDILAGKAEDVQIKSKIKVARAFDPEAIHEMYEKVRIMTALDEEMKKQKFLKETQNTGDGKIDGISESEEITDEPINLQDSCIWDEEEINILRKVFKTAKYQIKDLEVQLRETTKLNKSLEKNIAEKTRALEEANANLSEARKANTRLNIHCESLKDQLSLTSSKLTAVTEMWKEISEKNTALQKETHECRIKADKERLLQEQLQLKVQETSEEILREKHLAQENARNRYEKEIFDLQMELKNVREELNKEKQTHGITKKALNNLRQHFASLPLQDVMPPNAVTEDQVKEINFLEP